MGMVGVNDIVVLVIGACAGLAIENFTAIWEQNFCRRSH
jgi:hypothetical protein